ncbi:MAG: hypothetical protein HFH73_07595 [Lachnospiraceae bacterium]|nr:hypothetical protein [Lachnospiraceae bacterium]
MSEEKELQEPNLDEDAGLDGLADFVDFADLGDLDAASNLEVFGELGDIGDLGDLPDMTEMVEGSGAAPAIEEDAVIPVPDLEEDIPLPDMTDESLEPDIPLPDLAESEPETPEAPLPDMGEETFDDPLPDFAAEDGTLAADDEVMMKSVDPQPDAPDIFSDSSEAEALFQESGDSDKVDSGLNDDMILDDELASILDGTLSDIPDEVGAEDVLQDLDTGSESEPEAAAMDSLDESSIDDVLSGLDLGDADASIDGALSAVDTDAADDGGIDSMLGGLLDNLDMTGSIEEPEAAASEETDSMADILGIGNNPFGTDSMEELGSVSDMEDMLDVSDMIPDAGMDTGAEQEKEPGLLKKVFGNVITDEIAEQERMQAQKAEEEAAQKAEEDAKAKEVAEAEKAEKKAAKEAAKAEKKKEKEAKKAAKAAEKAEKKAKREEEEAAELEVVGKLNKVGVSIIVIATVLFLAVEITGTNFFSYASAKKEAMNYFKMGKYTEAYQEAIGTSMREKDEESYNKIKVVMKVQQSLNAYQNYDRIKYYPEALDSLLRGLKRYDANIDEGMDLEVEKDMMTCRKQILTLLQEEFNLSESEAYSIISLEKDAYQSRVIELGLKKK